MATADLWTADFPHGTAEGYRLGCQSNGACPRDEDGLQSCKQAAIRLQSDWEYGKLVKGGMTELEAARELGPKVVGHAAVFATPEPVAETPIDFDQRPTRPAPHAAFSLAQEAASAPKPGPVKNPAEAVVPLAVADVDGFEVFEKPARRHSGGVKKVPLDDPEFPHGTIGGYQRGCRVKNYKCPGDENGFTCPDAANQYQKDRKAARAAGAVVAPPVEEVPAVVEPIEVELSETSVSYIDAEYAAAGPATAPSEHDWELMRADRDDLLAQLTAAKAQVKLMSDSFDADSALIKAQKLEIERLREVVTEGAELRFRITKSVLYRWWYLALLRKDKREGADSFVVVTSWKYPTFTAALDGLEERRANA